MKNVIVFKEPQHQQYRASRVSLTYLFVILCNVCTVFVPFYFWTGTDGGLWLESGKYREQPEVDFLYKFILVLEATSAATGDTKEIFVSTMDEVNALRPEAYRAASVKFHKEDRDFDGRYDSFRLDAAVPLGTDERVTGAHALLFFDLRLRERVKLETEAIAYASLDSGGPVSGFDTAGSLVFRQARPLRARSHVSTLYAEDTPLLDAVNAPGDASIAHVLERYRNREMRVDYVERYPITSRVVEDQEFRLKMKVEVPEQELLYVPTLTEVLKDAWVKYASVIVVAWLLLEKLQSCVFRSLYPPKAHKF